jgi:DNA-binding response OmpR family regulator
MGHHILVVEDERRTAAIIGRYLERAGFRATFAFDGTQGLEEFRNGQPDLVVLDVMLPGTGGFEVCRAIRAAGDTPIIMLTARVGEEDRLTGLLGGADDYVAKPFSPRELIARIAAVLRRTGAHVRRPPMRSSVGTLALDPTSQTARVGVGDVGVTRTEYRILEALCTTPNVPWTRDRLVERVFGWDYDGTERTIDTHVGNLRRKLAATGSTAPHIVTSFGRGYAIEPAKGQA